MRRALALFLVLAAPHGAAADPVREEGFRGLATYYWHSQKTASGETYRPDGMTAAHRTLPFGTHVRVTHVRTKRTVIVRINDRGPFTRGVVIDLSRGAAQALGMLAEGMATVQVQIER
jgi:rare lipoprotein A